MKTKKTAKPTSEQKQRQELLKQMQELAASQKVLAGKLGVKLS